MANLETLELTISGNAESASQGLSSLIGSLSALSRQVGRSVGGLLRLNKELEKLKGFSNIKFSGIEKAAKDVKNAIDLPTGKLDALQMKMEGLSEAMDKAANRGNKLGTANKYLQSLNVQKQIDAETRALRGETQAFKANASVMKEYKNLPAGAFRPWMYGPKPLPKIESAVGSATMRSEEERRALNPQWYRDYNTPEGRAMILARNEALRHNGDQMSIASDPSTLEPFKEGYKEVEQIAEETAPKFQKLKEGWQNFTNGMKTASGRLKEIIPRFGMLNRVMRIASTMMIRMGVRALFKGMKEGLDNYYQYSKQIGGSYAEAMDKMNSAWSQLKNQMGAAIAPAFTAALPVINALADAAITAFNALSQLFALLTGKSTWSKATAQVSEYGDAINKANGGGGGGGMKELLAGFDELNVIASEGGGGGGGGAVKSAEELSNMFEEMTEFDKEIKDLVNWLESHLPVVNGLVAGIAAHLLGLPASISIGIGFVVTGLGITSEAGNDIGKNGLTEENFIEAIKGNLATVLGGALIGLKLGGLGGAAVGATVGFTVSLVMLGISMQKGATSKIYGDASYSAEEIRKAVQKYYYMEISPVVELTKAKIEGIDRLEEEIQDQVEGLNLAHMVAKNSNYSLADVATLAEKTKNLVKLTQALIMDKKEFSLMINAQINGDVTAEGLMATEGWTILSGIVGDLGDEIGKILSDGVVGEFEQNTLENLMGSLTRISAAVSNGMKAEQYKTSAMEIRDQFVNGDLSQDSFVQYIKAMTELESKTRNTASDAVRRDAENYASEIAGMEQALSEGITTWKGKDIGEALAQAKKYYNDNYGDQEKRNKAAEDLYNSWVGENGISQQQNDIISAYYSLYNQGKMNGADYKNLVQRAILNTRGQLKNSNGDINTDTIKDRVNQIISSATGQDISIILDAQNLFKISGWDMLSDDLRFNLVASLRTAFGSAKEALVALKETYQISVTDAIKYTKWDTLGEEQQIEFAMMIREIFGDEAVAEYVENTGGKTARRFAKALNTGLENERITTLRTQLLEKYPELFNAFDQTLLASGIAAQEVIDENWDFVMPMLDTYGFDTSLIMMKELIKQGGTEAGIMVSNWDLMVPMLDTLGLDKSVTVLKYALQYWGDDAELLLQNWWLIAPGIDMRDIESSANDLSKFISRSGVDLDTIIENWRYIAPAVTKTTIETSMIQMKEVAKQTGLSMNTIVGGWRYFAPAVSGVTLDNSLIALKIIANRTGLDMETLIKNWHLIAPMINQDNIVKSSQDISKLINKGVGSWNTILHAKLLISDITTPINFGNSVTDAVKGIYNKAASIVQNALYILVGVKSDGSSVTTTTTTSGGKTTVTAKTDAKAVVRNSQGISKVYASGGFPAQGDLFIANEAGAELVGSINGKTGVANQEQIIEGIQRGVSEANSEQNALLRQQNELLRGILEKDSSVRIGASAALGRIARQSLDLYGSMVGG